MPAVTPVTTPEVPTVATPGETELHTPPAAASVSEVVPEGHMPKVPVILPALGGMLTVTTAVAAAVPQLLVTVYDIVVVPGATPVTIPVAPTVATAGVTALHTPPPAALVNAVVAVGQTISVPVILPALGDGSTVTTTVAAAVPQLFTTV